ncbi:MAG: FecR family protein [Bacteroidaceae bacterium]
MEKNIKDIDSLILSFLEQTIAPRDLRFLRTWVKESTENKEYFTKLEEAWLISGSVRDGKEFDEKEAFAQFQQKAWNINRTKTISFRQVFYYAACICLAFLIGSGTKLFYDSPKADEVLLNYSLEAPRKSKLKVNLPDGSFVWLNAASSLSYNSKYGINNRDLSLQGEGYFEISKNPQLPLRITLGDAKVKVLGTKFNVQNYQDDEEIKVALLEGSVSFSNNKNDRLTILRPNHQIKYNKESGISTVKKMNASYAKAWISGDVFFNEEKLGSIAKVLERAFNISIHFENENLKNLIFYGDLTIEADNIVQIMDIMAATNKFSYKYKPNSKEVYILH